MDVEDRFTDSENEECKTSEVIQNVPPKRTSTNKKQLVSYCDDFYEDSSSEKEEVKSNGSQAEDAEDEDACALDNNLFPEPKGTCDPQLQDKITKMMVKMNNTNCDWNSVIQNKKSFRNPSIYEKLIEFCDINEFGTNYQPAVYDPNKWGKGSFYDDLHEVQKVEMEKRMEKDMKVVLPVAKAAGCSPPVEDLKFKKAPKVAQIKDVKVGKKRKRNTKWDPAPNTVAILPTVVKPAFSGLFQRMIFIKKP
nr:SAP30-binding protein [Halyomorpha halys]